MNWLPYISNCSLICFIQSYHLRIDNKKTPNERLYQRTIASTQIPHSSLKELHSQIMTYLDAAKIELKSIIDSYEVNVKPDSYEAYGVSLFEFSGYLNTAKCNK